MALRTGPLTIAEEELNVFAHPNRVIPADVPQITFEGNTDNFRVYYDNRLGSDGPTLAKGVLQSCELCLRRASHDGKRQDRQDLGLVR